MKLKIKETPDQKADKLIREFVEFEKKVALEGICYYLDFFEPKLWRKLLSAPMEAEEKFKADNSIDVFEEEIENLKKIWQKTHRRLTNKITRTDIKKIHILKSEKKIPDKEYRKMIKSISDFDSSKDLRYFEAKLLMKKMHDWERNNGKSKY